jgi:hypothetical protein
LPAEPRRRPARRRRRASGRRAALVRRRYGYGPLEGVRLRRHAKEFATTVTIDELTLADEPERWARIGFRVEEGEVRIGRVRLRLTGARDGSGMLDWSLRGIASTELDGLPTRSSRRPLPERAPAHPNGVAAVDHVVAFTPSFERSVDALQAAGLELRRVREQPTPAGAPRQAFFRLGAEILELIQLPEEQLSRAGGPGAPCRFWGLALTVEDLDATAAGLEGEVGEIRAAVQPGRRIATVRRAAGLAVPIALMSGVEGTA